MVCPVASMAPPTPGMSVAEGGRPTYSPTTGMEPRPLAFEGSMRMTPVMTQVMPPRRHSSAVYRMNVTTYAPTMLSTLFASFGATVSRVSTTYALFVTMGMMRHMRNCTSTAHDARYMP